MRTPIVTLALTPFVALILAAPANSDVVERAIETAPVETALDITSILYNNDPTAGPTTSIAAAVKSTWTDVAHYQAAVACGPEKVKMWSCGQHCSAVRDTKVVLFGGDNGATPWHYVANNGSHIIVSIKGTNSDNPLSIANNINFFLRKPSSLYFPQSDKTRVHNGFYQAFTRLAGPVATVINSELRNGSKPVLVLGHSQGAAIAELLSTYLTRLFGPSAPVYARLFAPPRVGNVPWANYVDSTFPQNQFQYLTNFNDPVPHLPPRSFGFRHPSNEVFIPAVGSPDMLACSGQENQKCSNGITDEPAEWFSSIVNMIDANVHQGPYAGVRMTCGA